MRRVCEILGCFGYYFCYGMRVLPSVMFWNELT